MIVLDRTLHSSVHYQTDYGFVPGTRGADGEHLDAMVMVDQSTFPGCVVEARIVGVISIEFSNGNPEQKLLGVPVREPRFAEYEDVSDVPGHLLKEIEHFLKCSRTWRAAVSGFSGGRGPRRPKSCSKRQSGRGRNTKKSPPRLPPELDRFRYALSPWVARTW
jgi:inorganic pyrophosphatase